MLQLVDQILDVRKIDNAKMTLKKERTDFMAFVKDVCERFRVEATEKQMQYTIDISTEALLMDVDRDKMEKVLYNVLSNAFKYTPDNGSIAVEVNVQTQEKMVVIEVKDTGIGIPESQLKSVFNRFYRADQNGGGNINGTGLGLSIVKNFEEMHGGKESVKNNREAGCIFSFTLPIDPSIQTQAELPVSAKEESSHVVAPQINQLPAEPENLENAPLVLIVDDNAEMRLFLENQLRGTYRVITADNGQKGLDEAIQHFPDLIISDVMMPLMDGLEFCTKVKSDVRICHIPVILLTARSSTDHQIEGIKTGADAYLTKPFNIDYLDARVQNLIESRVRLRAAFTQVTDEPKDIEKSVSNDLDKEFLQKATVVVETNMEDPSFTVPRFIQEMGMSNSVLYRKLKALTDLSANEFIRHIRLKKASEILQTGQFNVAEVAVKVGFNDPKYFSTCFKKQYGKSPMQYIQDM
jgi:DNA-binding response OmpR family regulator/anti-sigma regulatory factor (Ser/Thr protein kinase)